MARSIKTVRAQIHKILTGVGMARAMATAPRREIADAHMEPEQTPEGVRVTYTLRSKRDEPTNDLISQVTIIRRHEYVLGFSRFAGYDAEEAADDLDYQIGQAIDALENVNNFFVLETGLRWSGEFIAGAHSLKDERIACDVTFAVRYEHDVAAMALGG